MHTRLSTLVIPFVAAFAVRAQAPILVPSSATIPDGDSIATAMFWGSNSNNRAHTQALYPTADIGLGTGTITQLAFRRATSTLAPNAATSITLTIELSVSPTLATAPSANFAQNHGSNRTVVFQGTVQLPATPATTFPAPMLPPIVFQTPFAYDGATGNSLVVDIRTSDNTSHQPWFAAQQTIGFGSDTAHFTQSTCATDEGDISGGWGGRVGQPYPGGVLATSFLGYARKASFQLSVLLVGTQSIGGSFAGIPLPVPLTTLGLPASPSCQLAVSPDILLPMGYIPGSGGSPGAVTFGPITLANDPTMVGTTLYAQALSVDYDNDMPQPLWFPSMTLRWTFGTGHLPPCGQVTRLNDMVPSALSGEIELNTAPVLELTMQ